MAEIITRTVVELEQLDLFQELNKAYIDAGLAKKWESATFDETTRNVSFYTVAQPSGDVAPAFEFTLPEVDFTEIYNKIAEVEAKVDKNAEDIAELQTSKANASDVYTKEEVDSAIEESAYDDSELVSSVGANTEAIANINNEESGILAQAKAEVTALADGAVKANTESIEVLNGDEETDGSVAKAVKDSADAINATIGTVAEGKTVVGMIEDVIANGYDDTEIRDLIQDNADAIQAHKDEIDGIVTTLVGDDTGKSVRTIANEELAAQLLSGEADADFQTLQELAAWLESHPEDVATINLNISNLQKLVGTIPADATSTDVVSYIAEAVAAEKARAEGVESGLDARLQTVEAQLGDGEGSVDEKIATAKQEAIDTASSDATTKADKALDDAKAYADGLAGNYEVAGTAEAKVKELAEGQVATNTEAITTLQDAVGAIQYATEDDIRALFA